jgi:Ala-tRNA(Pro) deacylase
MRVPVFLTEHQVTFETLVHPPAYTAQKLARVLHVPGKQVAKGVLLAGPTGFVLAVLPATHQIDTEAIAAALGGQVRLAECREITELFRDCEWGVVTPFGAQYGLSTVIDESLDPNDWIVLEGHTHEEAIRMRCGDFERLEGARRLRFAKQESGIREQGTNKGLGSRV